MAEVRLADRRLLEAVSSGGDERSGQGIERTRPEGGGMIASVTKRRKVMAISFSAFTIAIVLLGLLPHRWHSPTKTPFGVATKNITYTCGATWGSNYVHGPTRLRYPVYSTPCGDRDHLRIAEALDLALGAAAVAIVVFWRREDSSLKGRAA
jgi:hypothetical protein